MEIQVGELNGRLKRSAEKLENMEKSVEISNTQYAESEKNNMKLMQELSEMRPLKQKYELLKIENDRLYSELRSRQLDVDDGNSKFLELTQSLNKALALLEDKKSVIGKLEAECERHAREKHLTCQAKIDELVSDCGLLREELAGKVRQVDVLTEASREAEKQVERYKADMKNFNFKEFVSMKRELNSLKQERERYAATMVALPAGKSSASSGTSETATIFPPISKDSVKKTSFQFF
jgi:chromosome segregation ATPase